MHIFYLHCLLYSIYIIHYIRYVSAKLLCRKPKHQFEHFVDSDIWLRTWRHLKWPVKDWIRLNIQNSRIKNLLNINVPERFLGHWWASVLGAVGWYQLSSVTIDREIKTRISAWANCFYILYLYNSWLLKRFALVKKQLLSCAWHIWFNQLLLYFK